MLNKIICITYTDAEQNNGNTETLTIETPHNVGTGEAQIYVELCRGVKNAHIRFIQRIFTDR